MPDEVAEPFDRDAALAALRAAWSAGSSTKWTPGNPALGQCSATALVLRDRFGGELLQTPVGGLPHFYNRIAGTRVDLTEAQFGAGEVVEYLDLPATEAEALADTSPKQRQHLAERFEAAMRWRRPPATTLP